jgi:hypothetical protein
MSKQAMLTQQSVLPADGACSAQGLIVAAPDMMHHRDQLQLASNPPLVDISSTYRVQHISVASQLK